MAIHFNHTIVSAHDSKASATFLAEMLNLAAPRRWGPFQVVVAENGANLDYMDTAGEITPQHYAFLVSEANSTRFSAGFGIEICLLGRSRAEAAGRDQSPRRRTRCLFRGSQRPPPRSHHPPVRQRRMESVKLAARYAAS